MNIIEVKLYVEDVMNPSNQEALEYVNEIINKAFVRESMKEHPRCKLILMESKHKASI